MTGSLRRLSIIGLMAGVLLAQPYRLVKVEGRSMEPALHDQSWIVMRRGAGAIRDGDIVTVEDGGVVMVKRVFAQGGEKLAGRMGCEQANGHVRDVRQFYTVPTGYLYLLGDNRSVSLDSRYFGPVPTSAVMGRVLAG